jgi:Predicted membrane protein
MVNILQNNNELLQYKNEILAIINNNPTIQFYLQVKDKLNNHSKILTLLDQERTLQQEIVNAKYINKQNQVTLLEQKLENIVKELNNIPLYQQYLTASEDAQQFLDEICTIINQELATFDTIYDNNDF